MTTAHHFIARDFDTKTRRALTKAGIRIIGAVNLPAASGDLRFARGERGYQLDNRGEHQIRTYSEVKALVA